MADITSYLDNDGLPRINQGVQSLSKAFALAADAGDNADNIQLFTLPPGSKWRIMDAVLRVSATLGASATVQLRINRGGSRTVLTAATSAGGASKVSSVAQAGVPFDAQGGDILELLVGGADISAAATATLDLFYRDRE